MIQLFLDSWARSSVLTGERSSLGSSVGPGQGGSAGFPGPAACGALGKKEGSALAPEGGDLTLRGNWWPAVTQNTQAERVALQAKMTGARIHDQACCFPEKRVCVGDFKGQGMKLKRK